MLTIRQNTIAKNFNQYVIIILLLYYFNSYTVIIAVVNFCKNISILTVSKVKFSDIVANIFQRKEIPVYSIGSQSTVFSVLVEMRRQTLASI